MSGRSRIVVFLVPGDLTVQTRPVNVKTILGSCVGVCLWDAARRIGGVNHFLLPAPTAHATADNRFGTIATPRLIQRLCDRSARLADLRAAVIGGGRPVFALKAATVGDENIAVALSVLREYGIRVVRQETGGAHGRKLLFNTASGALIVRPLRSWPRPTGAELTP